MRVSDRTNRPVELVTTTLRLNDQDAFTVEFDRNKVTRQWANSADNREGVFGMYEALCEVVTRWDVVNDDGSEYPLTPENMGALNFSLAEEGEIIRQIMVAAAPSRAEGNASSKPSGTPLGTSSPPPLTHQNGAPTSTSPALSASQSQT